MLTWLSIVFFSIGPKLFKEPSAKSNKHIIQNALAHCCLAGKVNEGQKNKILEVRKICTRGANLNLNVKLQAWMEAQYGMVASYSSFCCIM